MPKPRPEVPDDLTREEQLKLWQWVQTHHRHLTRHQVRSLVNECLLHHASIDNKHGYKRWWQVCAKWIEKDQRWADQRKEARPEPRVELLDEPTRLRLVK